jgi:hypothetical protein
MTMILEFEQSTFKLLQMGVPDDANFLKFEIVIIDTNCEFNVNNICWMSRRNLEALALFLDSICDNKENDHDHFKKETFLCDDKFFAPLELDFRIDYSALWNFTMAKENFILLSIFIAFYDDQGKRNYCGVSDFCLIKSIKNFSSEIRAFVHEMF